MKSSSSTVTRLNRAWAGRISRDGQSAEMLVIDHMIRNDLSQATTIYRDATFSQKCHSPRVVAVPKNPAVIASMGEQSAVGICT